MWEDVGGDDQKAVYLWESVPGWFPGVSPFPLLFRWLSLHACAGDLQHFPLRWQCQHGVQGVPREVCSPFVACVLL